MAMAGKTEYKNKWQSEKLDRISFVVPKGKKSLIQEHAATRGKSLNGFINEAVDEKIVRDNTNAPQ